MSELPDMIEANKFINGEPDFTKVELDPPMGYDVPLLDDELPDSETDWDDVAKDQRMRDAGEL